jgi:hypothetical protein
MVSKIGSGKTPTARILRALHEFMQSSRFSCKTCRQMNALQHDAGRIMQIATAFFKDLFDIKFVVLWSRCWHDASDMQSARERGSFSSTVRDRGSRT